MAKRNPLPPLGGGGRVFMQQSHPAGSVIRHVLLKSNTIFLNFEF
jgi:hypothetical protein